MTRPKVSIIVPIRNEAMYIDRCLSSLCGQTYPADRLEVLVVDGMSTDGTRERVKIYTSQYPYFELLDNPQQTAPYAMNIGLQRATGDILIRVDGHCEVANDYVETCVNTLNQVDAACVGGALENRGETDMAKAISLAMSSPFGVGNARFRYAKTAGYVDTLAFGAYRREVFERIGLFNTDLTRNQDDELNYRLRAAGEKIYLSPKIRSVYYTRANLKSLWRQYFQYGYWKIRVLRDYPASLLPRHLVPAIFIMALFGGGIFFILGIPWIFWSVLIPYLGADLIFSCKQAWGQWRHLPRLLFIFPILHLAYGSGFLWGLMRFLMENEV